MTTTKKHFYCIDGSKCWTQLFEPMLMPLLFFFFFLTKCSQNWFTHPVWRTWTLGTWKKWLEAPTGCNRRDTCFRLGSKPEHVEETHDNTLRTRRLQHRKDPSHTETEPRTSSLRDHGGFLVNTRSSCSIWRYKMFLHLFMPPKNLQLFRFVFIAAGEIKKNN